MSAPSSAGLAVHHLAVVVADLDRAERFYAGVLGLPVIARHDDAAGAPRAVWLGLGGGAFLAIERAASSDPRRSDEAPGWHCVALGIAVDDREAWRVRLADAGHPVERSSAFTLYTRDPDGCLVALSHHPTPVHDPARP
jgi:catechol 2,3-dioxygenase-like lactoylglutathione lyase family enzyme